MIYSNFKNISFNIKSRGFTLGLALIVVATTLLISVSISSILIRDIKNSTANERGSMAYNLAESALECAVGYESNIRYFDIAGNNITGVFPASLNHVNTSISYSANEFERAESPFGVAQNGYAYKNYIVGNTNNTNRFFTKEDVRCFGNEILSNINPPTTPPNNEVITTLDPATSNAPTGYYNANPLLNGVLTKINIRKDINYNTIGLPITKSFFLDYTQSACIELNIYSVFEDGLYKKIISAEASVPCNDLNASKRVLVRYTQ
jgi:hypothetical protein